MTALTSALALNPLAVGGSLPGNEIQSPMAQVILGGLLSSTLLNGFVIPVVYQLLNRKKEIVKETRYVKRNRKPQQTHTNKKNKKEDN